MISASVHAYLLQNVQADRERFQGSLERKAWWGSLEGVAALVASAGDKDGRLRVLERTSVLAGAQAGRYLPGPRQVAVLQRVPQTIESTPPQDILGTLIVAAVDDLHDKTIRRVDSLTAEVDRARTQVRELENRTVDRSEVDALRDATRRHAQVDRDKSAQIQELRQRLGGLGTPAWVDAVEVEDDELIGSHSQMDRPEPDGPVKNKQRVPGHPGIFFMADRDGKVVGYGAGWPNPEFPSKTKTKAGFSSIAEAERYRAERLGVGRPQGGTAASVKEVLAAVARG